MNWEAIGTIGEIIGSVAVVISLVYVSVQIRHANKQSEIDSLRHTWDALNELADRFSESPETASLIIRGRQSLDALSEEENFRFVHLHMRMLNTLESWYLQVNETSKPGPWRDNHMANIAETVRGYLDFPGTRQMWLSLRAFYIPIAELVDRNLSADSE